MVVSIELTGFLRDIAKTDRVAMPIVSGTTAADALEFIAGRYPDLPLDRASFLITVNRELVSPNRPLHPNDVVCLVPHIGGG